MTSDVSAEGPLEAGVGDPRETVYRPRRGKIYRSGLLLLLFGLFIGAAPARDVLAWIAGSIEPSGRTILGALAGLASAGMGLLIIVGALRGLPRLTASPDGLRLETAFGSRSAAWGSLGPFAAGRVYTGFGRSIANATAAVTGTEASRNLCRRKKFFLPDAFVVPLDVILADLNRRRAWALGATAAEPAPVGQGADRIGLTTFRFPWLTFALLAVLAAFFAAEQILAVESGGPLLRPGIKTLLALGGLNRELVLGGGEWYRLFTAPLLHADVNHLVFNGIALLLVGYLLEKLMGRVWFLAFFVIGALGGAVCSLAINPATLASVGASGAIMGLFAAAFVGSFRLPAGTLERSRMQFRSMRVLVPSLVPLAAGGASGQIDYAAHFGGALSGTAVALVLLRTWPATMRLPRFRKLAGAVAALGVLLAAGSAAEIGRHYDTYRRFADFMPKAEQPKTDEEIKSRAASLVARYPADPRAHLYSGFASMAARDYADAERELRTALRQAQELRFYFGPRFENTLRVLLAAVLVDEHRAAEAKEVAQPVCAAPTAERPAESLAKVLGEQHLCG
jgi:rhomboid protease GluP